MSDDRGAVAVRRTLVALQMGAAGTVVVAGVLLASGLAVQAETTASESAGAVMTVTLPLDFADGGWQAVLDLMAEVPGIEAESLGTRGSLGGVGVRDYVTAQCGNCYRGGLPMPFWSAFADHYAVTPGFFELAGFELTEGRAFRWADREGAAGVAVVNRTFANTAFEDGEPLGRQIRVGRDIDGWFTVVGVVEDWPAAVPGGRTTPGEAVYLSLLQHPPRSAVALVRGDDHAVDEAWTRLSALGLAPGDVQPAARYLDSLRAPQRWAALVAVFLASVILLLATFGTRAVSAQIVWRSTHGLSIRRVLGANDGRILRHVLMGAVRSGLWGAAISVFFGTLTVALLRKALGGLPTPGPLPYLLVTALLTCTALAASWGAARAATRIPPAAALQ